MPSYSYNNGDGLAVLDKTLPNGATEPVSNLDDALKQVKAYLVDSVGGAAKLRADATDQGTRLTAAEADIATLQTDGSTVDTDVTALQAQVGSLQNQVDGLSIASGGTPSTAIILVGATQAVAAGAGATTVQYNTTALDTRGGYSVSTFTYTAPNSGLYSVMAAILVSTTASSSPTAIAHTLEIYVNGISGGKVVVAADNDTSNRVIQLQRLFQLAGTNTIIVKYTVAVGSGSMTSTIQIDTGASTLQISRITS